MLWFLLAYLKFTLAANDKLPPSCTVWTEKPALDNLASPSAADACQAVIYIGSAPPQSPVTSDDVNNGRDGGSSGELCGWNADSACFSIPAAFRMRTWLQSQVACSAIAYVCFALALSHNSSCELLVTDTFYAIMDRLLEGKVPCICFPRT